MEPHHAWVRASIGTVRMSSDDLHAQELAAMDEYDFEPMEISMDDDGDSMFTGVVEALHVDEVEASAAAAMHIVHAKMSAAAADKGAWVLVHPCTSFLQANFMVAEEALSGVGEELLWLLQRISSGFDIVKARAAWEPREDDAWSVGVPSARRFCRASASSAGASTPHGLSCVVVVRESRPQLVLRVSSVGRICQPICTVGSLFGIAAEVDRAEEALSGTGEELLWLLRRISGSFDIVKAHAAREPREDDAQSMGVPSARRFCRASASSAGRETSYPVYDVFERI
ncbi:hypothetical protein Taro_017565 [Colocasia esculenta]|uniref:Uncharacterized protein n=1 Tax=Colocasia esculenta TaxID=4460 RepID=A0A843UGH9_COLES|nr:hypothetical protein [Colocasia esculenta]